MQLPTKALRANVAASILAVLFALALWSLPCAANDEVQKGITTTGHGEVKGQPDVARVTLSVLTQANDQGQAVEANAKTMTEVRDALVSKFGLSLIGAQFGVDRDFTLS